MQDVIDELRRYVVGWLNYFSLSDTYTALLELDEWVRRRVRLYYWWIVLHYGPNARL